MVEDINTVVANLATKQDLHNEIKLLESRIDAKFGIMDGKFEAMLGTMDGKFAAMDGKIDVKFAEVNAKFKITQAYLIIIGILTASSSPLFAPLVQGIEHLLH